MKEENLSKEFDIIRALSKMFKRKWSLAIFLITFTVLGIIVAVNNPKTYTSEVILAPEIQSGGMADNISDMASKFGLDIGGKKSPDAIYPEIYPVVVGSTEFIRNLFDVRVRIVGNDTVRTYIEHLTKDNKAPFWALWMLKLSQKMNKNDKLLKAGAGTGEKDEFQMSKLDYDRCEIIRANVACLVDNKTSIITISCTDQDPLVAAILADTIQQRLQEYINKYKTKKSRNDVRYYKKLVGEALAGYKKAQAKYAAYADSNQDLTLQIYQSKVEELENDMQMKYNVYTQMMAQYQGAMAKLQESTPAYTVLQRPVMPYKASSTPRSLIVVAFFFLGFLLDAVWALLIAPHLPRTRLPKMPKMPDFSKMQLPKLNKPRDWFK